VDREPLEVTSEANVAENDYRFPIVDLPPDAAVSPEAAVRFLVGQMVASGQLRQEHAEAVIEQVLCRESKGSTGIGRGIAVPHSKSGFVDRVVGVEARSELPVAWPGAADSAPVRRVCVLVTPATQPGESLRALKEIVQRLQAQADPSP
jgi:PTS system fructose-specific IIA component/PTS system nitrogen regulatory IIA component